MTQYMNQSLVSETDFYRTSDLALATVISLHYPIEAIDHQNPRKALFSFSRNEKLDELIKGYWRGELKVEPQSFFNQLRQIKSRIYAE